MASPFMNVSTPVLPNRLPGPALPTPAAPSTTNGDHFGEILDSIGRTTPDRPAAERSSYRDRPSHGRPDRPDRPDRPAGPERDRQNDHDRTGVEDRRHDDRGDVRERRDDRIDAADRPSRSDSAQETEAHEPSVAGPADPTAEPSANDDATTTQADETTSDDAVDEDSSDVVSPEPHAETETVPELAVAIAGTEEDAAADETKSQPLDDLSGDRSIDVATDLVGDLDAADSTVPTTSDESGENVPPVGITLMATPTPGSTTPAAGNQPTRPSTVISDAESVPTSTERVAHTPEAEAALDAAEVITDLAVDGAAEAATDEAEGDPILRSADPRRSSIEGDTPPFDGPATPDDAAPGPPTTPAATAAPTNGPAATVPSTTMPNSPSVAIAGMDGPSAPSTTTASTPATGPTPPPGADSDVDGVLVRQISRALASIRTVDGEQTFTIRLRPEELGAVTVRVTTSDAGVRIGLVTDSAATADRLSSQRDQLLAELDQGGLAGSDVDVSHHGEQGRDQSDDDSMSGDSSRHATPNTSRSNEADAAARRLGNRLHTTNGRSVDLVL